MLLQARVAALAEKLKEFSPEETEILTAVLTHHHRQRSELFDQFKDMKFIDAVTSKAVNMGILNLDASTYTFTPNPDWRDYLEDALLVKHARGQV